MICSRWLAVAAFAGSALGCNAAALGELSDSRDEQIVAGEPSGADQDGVVLVRAVLLDQSEIVCSASLVGPNLLLTAAHCVTYLTEGDFSCSVTGELIDNKAGGGRLGLYVAADSLEIYAGKTPRKAPLAHGLKVISTLPPDVCQDDLAFVVLDTALELPILPMRLGRPALVHEATVLVGYGTAYDNQLIDYRTQRRQQKRGLEVAAVGPDSLDDGVVDTPPRVLNIEGPCGCVGDSGGPLLAESTGAVLGVYSVQGGGGCAAPAVHSHLVHVPPYQGLIDRAFAEAGCEPVPEVMPAAGGASDAGGAGGAVGEINPEPTVAAGGVGGAAGEAAQEPEPTPQGSERSGCSVVTPQRGAAEAPPIAFALVLGAIARRRRAAERRVGWRR